MVYKVLSMHFVTIMICALYYAVISTHFVTILIRALYSEVALCFLLCLEQ